MAMGEPGTRTSAARAGTAPDLDRLLVLTEQMGIELGLMRWLVVVAHPDDESFGCGSVLAAASAAGDETVVLCATRGEAGESRIRTDDSPRCGRPSCAEAAAHPGRRNGARARPRRLRAGAASRPGTLAAAHARRPSWARCRRSCATCGRMSSSRSTRATATVRDHARLRARTLAAVDAVGAPADRDYLWCLARSSMAKWVQHVHGHEAYLRWASSARLTTRSPPCSTCPTSCRRAGPRSARTPAKRVPTTTCPRTCRRVSRVRSTAVGAGRGRAGPPSRGSAVAVDRLGRDQHGDAALPRPSRGRTRPVVVGAARRGEDLAEEQPHSLGVEAVVRVVGPDELGRSFHAGPLPPARITTVGPRARRGGWRVAEPSRRRRTRPRARR